MPTLKEMAKESGLSQSTLSRALNHCPGTGEDAARIASALSLKYGLNPYPPGRYSIGVILPEGPRFFWQMAWNTLQTVLDESGVPYRSAFIESVSCGDLASTILREMEVSGIKAVIMPYFSSCADYIRQSKMQYFFLCEPSDLANTFSFCSDGYRDGLRLAQLLRRNLPDLQRVVVVRGDNETASERMRGFTEGMGRERILGDLLLPAVRLPLFPSMMAREITAKNMTSLDTICCLSGVAHKAALAVHKLKLQGRVVVAGFENPSPSNQYISEGTIAALMIQDICGQSTAAANAAIAYVSSGLLPETQYTLIDSTPLINPAYAGEDTNQDT
ncbi:MAG: LacI family DNA-binding transcriptional regulator [Clostridia bacterium]|nr:LacI family DNA-binding transcriptional regulator [Clostridia bacterium]